MCVCEECVGNRIVSPLALMETIYGKINDRLWRCQLKTNKQARIFSVPILLPPPTLAS